MFTVIAEDRDEGTNALIEFSLSSAESQDVFMIIQTNGSIFVHPDANIDYEERTSYTVTHSPSAGEHVYVCLVSFS